MKAIYLLSLLLSMGWALRAQSSSPPNPSGNSQFTISGFLRDAGTGETLLYASVQDVATGSGTTTNLYGFYSLSLPAGSRKITFSYVGYQPHEVEIMLDKNVELNITLKTAGETLQEVVVEGRAADAAVQEVRMSRLDVPVTDIKKLPSLLGEPDIIKMVQTLPGVTSAGEGTSSFYVRGGSADQNLILIDEAPVYEVSHFFGLYSVFNSDIIKSAELYKGGIPSKYGGRLSSLLEVTTRDGNNQRLSGSGGIGLLAAKASLEGPIGSEEASFIVSGRRSYADVFMKMSEDLKENAMSFHDLNAKVSWKPNQNNRLFLAAYSGRDAWNFGDSFGIDWGNKTATLRWNHLFSDRLFSNLSLVYSNFDYQLGDNGGVDAFTWKASQEEVSLKLDNSFFLNAGLKLHFGYQGIYRRFSPGEISPNDPNSIFKAVSLDEQYALEHALYAGVEQRISERLSLEYGLRYTIFQQLGEGTIYYYEQPNDQLDLTIRDSVHYGSMEPIITYSNPEPRFSARYLINSSSSLKFSYNRMVQNIHLMSNSTVPIPFNTWSPSSPHLQPQKADQWALGYFQNLRDNSLEFSVEAYYKISKDVTEFADHADIFFNEHLAQEFRQGEGTSYGLEFYLRKAKGRLRGFTSYTLSKTEMTIPDVNEGNPFPANHDRRHQVNMALTYDINDKWNVGANFTYGSGRPITLPTGSFTFDNYQVNYYSGRNGYRLPALHRLDLSATLEPRKNAGRRWKNSYNFGIYNVYNRKNPFTIYTRKKQDEDGNIIGDGNEREARMIYLFGILPYASWSFHF
jgi:hypothetical protein